MRNRILISAVVVSLFFALITVANANANEVARITSERGVTQAQFEASSQFQSFICPEGTGRGIGIDMNFTTDRSDDTWFMTCNIIGKIIPRPLPVETVTAITLPVAPPTIIETVTVLVAPVVVVQPVEAKQIVVATPVATVETTTAIVDTLTVSVLKSVSAMPKVIKITRDKNGKLIITKKPITVKVRKAVKR
jgi:hypothetical protein